MQPGRGARRGTGGAGEAGATGGKRERERGQKYGHHHLTLNSNPITKWTLR